MGRTMEKGEERRRNIRRGERERERKGDGTMHASAQFAPSFQIMI